MLGLARQFGGRGQHLARRRTGLLGGGRDAGDGEEGGADDGKTGRLRLQGFLQGPMPVPTSRTERDKLRDRAVKNGPQIPDRVMDQAAFAFEWETPDDEVQTYRPADETQEQA